MDANQNNQSESVPLLRQILAWLTDPNERTREPNPMDHQRGQLSELMENGYKSNDLVEVSTGFSAPARYLKINGTTTIRLTTAEFVVLFILVAHGQCLRRMSVPCGEKFLSAQDLLFTVDDWRKEERRLIGFWENATFAELHRTVCELRKKIRESGANPNLIETGPAGEGGYRLSTPPHNVTIVPR